MRAIGIGIPFFRRRSGVDAQAQVHYNRVIADGGVVPSGLSGVNAFFSAVKAIYGTTDINTAISAAYDAHYLGYKLGAGSGTTLGQAAQKMYAPKGIFGGIGTGSAYWDGTGVAFNFVSTPNAAANQITGDIEINARFIHRTSGSEQIIIAKNQAATNLGYRLRITNGNNISFTISLDGSTIISVLSTFTLTNNQEIWVRCTRNATTGVMNLFTSNDGITYTLNNTATNATGNIFNTTTQLTIGSNHNGASDVCHGRIYRATIANSIGGTPVVDFNANQYTGANTWTSTTSEVWTVNSTGAGLADVVQTTAASQPLLLAHSGANYYFQSGVNSNFVSTPNAAANQITGDIEIIVKAAAINWATDYGMFVAKNSGGTNGWCFFTRSSKRLGYVSTRGEVVSTVGHSFVNNEFGWVKVTHDTTNGIVKFYTSTDGISYTQLGANVSTTAGATTNQAINVEIGTNAGGGNQLGGKVERATISNSIGGTPVVDFNPASYNPSVSQTQWTSATGEIWSISTGTATSGYKGVLVDRSIVQSDGIDDGLSPTSNILLFINGTAYSAWRIFETSTGNKSIVSLGNNPNEIDIKINTNRINNVIMFSSALNLRFVAMQRNEIALQGISNVNNGATTTNTITVVGTNLNRMYLFQNIFGQQGNGIVNTAMVTPLLDNATTRTAVYNYIKTLNNNAF